MTGIVKMMAVSAAGGLSDSKPNIHKNGQSGRGFAPLSVGSGGRAWAFRSDHRGNGNDDDHHQRREKHVLQHRFAEERLAAAQFFFIGDS